MTQTIFNPSTTLIRAPEVMRIIGYSSRGAFDKLRARDPAFPRAVKLSNSTARQAPVAWVLGEVQDWVESRKACRDAAA
jgi:prophage regulatory protein